MANGRAQSPDTYTLIARLTGSQLPPSERERALREFAERYGWLPSDEIAEYPGTEDVANGHIVVEHGLDNTAVITFLRGNSTFTVLDLPQQMRLLSISYNNLVEWHIFPDRDGLTAVYNRVTPFHTQRLSLAEDASAWRSETFDRITGRRPNPNVKALDDALVDTVSFWKRALPGELGRPIGNASLSTLFNSIFFVRALEDHRRKQKLHSGRVLLGNWQGKARRPRTILSCIQASLRQLNSPWPRELLDDRDLALFAGLDSETVARLFGDFYDNKYAPYPYDFSLMSKHALSRIYEHYVSLLREEQVRPSGQRTFFPDLPEEERNLALGGVYTPQFVARFFARYLKENLTPRAFRGLKTADPACGSGIFLRTILEMQCDPRQEVPMAGPTKEAFGNVLGIDIDPSACQATRLSLALLHLVLTDELPARLHVENAESVGYLAGHAEMRESWDAVITNPPFVKWDQLSGPDKRTVKVFMGAEAAGKPDLFLAHLKLGLEMLKPGGHLLYVLPHSFLIASNAAPLRERISRNCWVRLLADLSEIPVFEGVGCYVILLVIQKKPPLGASQPRVTVVRCREFPGRALQAAIQGHCISTDLYDVFEVPQAAFQEPEWRILRPGQAHLRDCLSRFLTLDRFLEVREGFATGANEVFVRDCSTVPAGEEAVYVPYLTDREMVRYSVPAQVQQVVFYPYVEGRMVDETLLRRQFRQTWKYLETHRQALEKRGSVISGRFDWWRPETPRVPKSMLRPKIVTPHLVLMPRFSLDVEGRYAVSHAPFLCAREDTTGSQIELLRYFLAVLNSSVSHWQTVTLSHKYSHGYAMLEPKTLKQMRVPDPSQVPAATMKSMQRLVEKRLSDESALDAEAELDSMVADLYGLTREERIEIGMEG